MEEVLHVCTCNFCSSKGNASGCKNSDHLLLNFHMREKTRRRASSFIMAIHSTSCVIQALMFVTILSMFSRDGRSDARQRRYRASSAATFTKAPLQRYLLSRIWISVLCRLRFRDNFKGKSSLLAKGCIMKKNKEWVPWFPFNPFTSKNAKWCYVNCHACSRNRLGEVALYLRV